MAIPHGPYICVPFYTVYDQILMVVFRFNKYFQTAAEFIFGRVLAPNQVSNLCKWSPFVKRCGTTWKLQNERNFFSKTGWVKCWEYFHCYLNFLCTLFFVFYEKVDSPLYWTHKNLHFVSYFKTPWDIGPNRAIVWMNA